MSESKPIGQIIDNLGVTADIADDALVASAVVLAKVIDAEGQTSLLIANSEGTSWLEQLGLVAAASDVIRDGGYQRDDDDA